MATASTGAGGIGNTSASGTASTPGSLGPKLGQKGAAVQEATQNAAQNAVQNAAQTARTMSGQGAQFIYAAATVANILCDNLTQQQINLLANFFSVITTCVYAVLTVENPRDIIQ